MTNDRLTLQYTGVDTLNAFEKNYYGTLGTKQGCSKVERLIKDTEWMTGLVVWLRLLKTEFKNIFSFSLIKSVELKAFYSLDP